MIIVGLTGGIGSGKTTVANMFEELQIPVYIADNEAKLLMNRSKVIRRKLIALFGDEAYILKELNKPFIASKIFSNKAYLEKMNAIVHPKVASHFKRWFKKQTSPYIIKEAAIIFEQNKDSQYDYIITVIANKEERINRVLKRDNTSRKKIEAILKNQLSDKEKIKRSDFVIINNNLEETKNQVLKLHKKLLRLHN
ncbi:dephospho-CoA kinase [Ichthyenterobacterium magnum]|uniref:Dephospho-CoA kinase n=1 Tax=Ichthyenterobacterium magnum TaxID=1230530 RepID=A0A420DLL4_9FLAO|nr:dephospho-CoA kinase [Ichthyenterobacterium magnum]RKE95091.1 dephospho-CoA kinase [Ichthyenterobacterium magnum]